MKYFIFLPLIMLLLGPAARAGISQKDCAPFDIRQRHPQLAEFLSTPRNQDSIGWCYAFAAADLLSIEVGRPLSAIHMSSIYNTGKLERQEKHQRRMGNNFFYRSLHDIGSLLSGRRSIPPFAPIENQYEEVMEGGHAWLALRDAVQKGSVCTEERMPFDKTYSREFHLTIMMLEDFKRELRRGTYTEEEACGMLSRGLPRLGFSRSDVQAIHSSLLTEDMNTTLEKLIQSECQDAMIPLPRKLRARAVRKGKNPERFLRKLNDRVSSGKALAIGYNPDSISRGEAALSSHASVIVGRRWHNGRCEFKVRNSYGRSCALYRENVECIREEGSFWIKDEDLQNITHSFDYIK